jgi:signal transduction histidine kinase
VLDERLERFLLRIPYAVVALDPDLNVVFANGPARALLGASTPSELRAYAQHDVPRTTELQLADGRVLLVSGLAATAEDPTLLFVEDVSERSRQERVLREFLRNAAHQLRTPVAGITAAIETLQAGAKERPEDRDRFLAHIEQQAERLRRVARGVLQLARSRAGEAPPIEPVELRPLFDRLVQETGLPGDLEPAVDCPTGLAALAAPDLLHEVLAVLLDNAVAHAAGSKVGLSAAEADGFAVLAVTDQGPGIEPDVLDRVFEPFFRVAASGEGFGLGLAIAAQAVETMGGEIGVSSTVGSGTTFTVKLPAATVAQ